MARANSPHLGGLGHLVMQGAVPPGSLMPPGGLGSPGTNQNAMPDQPEHLSRLIAEARAFGLSATADALAAIEAGDRWDVRDRDRIRLATQAEWANWRRVEAEQ